MHRGSLSRLRLGARQLAGVGALLVGVAGASGVALANPATAGAASSTQTINATLSFSCTVAIPTAGITLSNQTVPASLAITAPATITAGSSFTIDTTSNVSLPSAVTSLASSLGITGVEVTNVSTSVSGTDVAPSPQDVSAENLPFTVPEADFASGVSATLKPLTFTAGSAGTAVFSAGALTVDATVEGGSFANDATTITCGAPASPTVGSLTIAAAVAAPTVSSVSPSSGSTAGGTQVTITGTNLSGATAVDFGSVAATGVSVNSAGTQITATSPAGSAGTVDVTVTTAGGTSKTSSADEFTYVVPAPTVSSVSPSSGSTAGGTQVTITGTNLSGATAVDFGSVAATGVSVNSAGTQITATSPAGSAGTVDVTVTTAGGTSKTSSADEFTYVAPVVVAPKLSAISPSSGSKAGGTQVTITGTNLSGATAVDFGSVAATGVSVNSAGTQITATSPAGSAGTVDVTVTTAGGTSNGLAYTYTAPPTASAPQVTDLFPRSGSVQGYALVWVFGKNFTNVTGVTFGSTKALYRDFGPELLVALAPPASEAGTVDVRVTTQAGGTSPVSSADQYTYQKEMCFLFFCFG
jgi:hypothetical protein